MKELCRESAMLAFHERYGFDPQILSQIRVANENLRSSHCFCRHFRSGGVWFTPSNVCVCRKLISDEITTPGSVGLLEIPSGVTMPIYLMGYPIPIYSGQAIPPFPSDFHSKIDDKSYGICHVRFVMICRYMGPSLA